MSGLLSKKSTHEQMQGGLFKCLKLKALPLYLYIIYTPLTVLKLRPLKSDL